MKLTIQAGSKSREIVGPFDICIDSSELYELVDQLTEVQKRWKEDNVAYGRIRIAERVPLGNKFGPTKPWDEE